ncbi:MAG TPA: SdpI family protein [Rhodanobacteraceae bacterium]|jgi:uncharacterized membrane protein|nr:SdpI family protein [Rhodanobacteraceae bacterium]
MKQAGTLVVSGLFVATLLGVAVWLYPQLPAQAPIHWDADGQVNGWAPRFWAVAVPVLVLVALAIMTPLLPRISPRKFEIKPFARVYGILMLTVQGFLVVVSICALLAAAGYDVPIPLVVSLCSGALFMVLGNYMGKLRKNFFVGIRTPWTLASDAVWERTHRLGGWLFVLAGLAWMGLGLAGAPGTWLIAVVLIAALVPCVYSYFIYRRLQGSRQLED